MYSAYWYWKCSLVLPQVTQSSEWSIGGEHWPVYGSVGIKLWTVRATISYADFVILVSVVCK